MFMALLSPGPSEGKAEICPERCCHEVQLVKRKESVSLKDMEIMFLTINLLLKFV